MIGQREVEEICRETSVEKVRAVMERVDKGGSDTESTFTGIRHVKYDPDTLINDRHIQSGEIGRWKDELTKEQQQYVNQAFKEFLESAIL